jgi:hypothetical protein
MRHKRVGKLLQTSNIFPRKLKGQQIREKCLTVDHGSSASAACPDHLIFSQTFQELFLSRGDTQVILVCTTSQLEPSFATSSISYVTSHACSACGIIARTHSSRVCSPGGSAQVTLFSGFIILFYFYLKILKFEKLLIFIKKNLRLEKYSNKNCSKKMCSETFLFKKIMLKNFLVNFFFNFF